MALDLFLNEKAVRKIGGKLKEDYYCFKREIEYINDYFFELFCLLGLTDIDTIVDALNNGLTGLKTVFIDKTMRDLESGETPRYKYLSPRLKKKLQGLTPEAEEKLWRRETHRSLVVIYNNIYKKQINGHWLFCQGTRHSKRGLEIFRKALFVAPSRIEIDGQKFLEIYYSYLEVEKSETKKQHEQAAEALNKFFNGTEITQEELSRYFILENGFVRVRSKSINAEDYCRLGTRGVSRNTTPT